MIRRRGLTLVGVAVANLDSGDAVQLLLPFDRHAGWTLDAAVDEVRERFGSDALKRAVLVGRPERWRCRCCPTRASSSVSAQRRGDRRADARWAHERQRPAHGFGAVAETEDPRPCAGVGAAAAVVPHLEPPALPSRVTVTVAPLACACLTTLVSASDAM